MYEESVRQEVRSYPNYLSKQATLHRFGFGVSTESATAATKSHPTTVMDYHGLFSDKEIREAPGMEKDFRLFWNAQAKELCSNSAVRCHLGNKSGLVGAIKTSWVLHKCKILQLQYDELEKLAVVYGDESTIASKLESAQKNIARIFRALTAVQETYAEISKATSHADKAKFSVSLSSHMSELRKSQDAFQKAYKRKLAEIAQLQQEHVVCCMLL